MTKRTKRGQELPSQPCKNHIKKHPPHPQHPPGRMSAAFRFLSLALRSCVAICSLGARAVSMQLVMEVIC